MSILLQTDQTRLGLNSASEISARHFGTDISSRGHLSMCKFWFSRESGTGKFCLHDFSARENFSTGIFQHRQTLQHLDITGILQQNDASVFVHLGSLHSNIDILADILDQVPKCPQYQDIHLLKCPRAIMSLC